LSQEVEVSHMGWEYTICGFAVSVQEFVIDTPCENAQKMYIGNAMSGNYAAVFAQLIINGRSQGLSPTCKLEEFSLLLLLFPVSNLNQKPASQGFLSCKKCSVNFIF
jgi:hypothetical protein